MNEKNPNLENFESKNPEQKEVVPVAERKKMAYSEALKVFREHDSAELEAEQLLFRERIAKNGPEAALAGIDLKIAAAEQQRDIYREKEDRFSEEAWAVRVKSLLAMRDMFALYCDMLEKAPDVANYMEEDMPWLKDTLQKAEAVVAADDYTVDEDHRKAA